jgi:sugar phosphate isomerase/epimerase
VEPLNLPLTIDVSHSFIALQGDNQGLEEHLEKFHVFATYFHLADSMGIIHDALPLGTGRINWRMVKPYVNDKDFIFEVDLKSSNFTDCTPMVVSAEYFQWIE